MSDVTFLEERLVHIEYRSEISAILDPNQAKDLHVHELPEGFSNAGSYNPPYSYLWLLGLRLISEDWPVFVQLSNSRVFGCDLIVSATGVEPNSGLWLQGSNPVSLLTATK